MWLEQELRNQAIKDEESAGQVISVSLMDFIEKYRKKIKKKVGNSADLENEFEVIEKFIFDNYEKLIHVACYFSDATMDNETVLESYAGPVTIGQDTQETFQFNYGSSLFAAESRDEPDPVMTQHHFKKLESDEVLT